LALVCGRWRGGMDDFEHQVRSEERRGAFSVDDRGFSSARTGVFDELWVRRIRKRSGCTCAGGADWSVPAMSLLRAGDWLRLDVASWSVRRLKGLESVRGSARLGTIISARQNFWTIRLIGAQSPRSRKIQREFFEILSQDRRNPAAHGFG